MNIAFLLGSLNRGGTETLLLDTLRHIQETSIKPTCICRMRGLLYEDFVKTGVKMIELKPRHQFDIKYIFKLRRAIRKQSIQITHAQQPLDALYAYLACIGLKTKLVLTIHGYDYNYPKITKQILKFIHKRINLNIFVSHSQKRYFVDKYGFSESKTKVLYNGISFSKFDNIKHHSIREEFNIPEDHLLLGSVGNFNPGRDQLTICRFLNLLNQKGIRFSFVFAGAQTKADPWYWDECTGYCKANDLSQNVHFPGLRNDIPNFLSQLDAFVYSTDHDTFGIAVIEAMYMGIPVFINNWKVFEEITDQGRHANLYQTRNEKDLNIKFLDFLENKEFFGEKARLDRVWVKDQYSIQSHIHNLLKIYRSVLFE
ncbi:MAG: glycosyltransferase family 4 protein [Bacteroidetes bacterium]|nr:glycosyltransferase family 4 protein [Bacteroidota bacterium]